MTEAGSNHDRRKGIVRTTVLLVAVALAIYLTFILFRVFN